MLFSKYITVLSNLFSDKLLDEFVANGFQKNLTIAENFDELLKDVLRNSIDFQDVYDGLENLTKEISAKLDVDSFFVKVIYHFFQNILTRKLKALQLHINKVISDVQKAIEYIEENSSFSIEPESVKLTLPHPLFLLQVPYSSSLLSSLTFLNDPVLHQFNQLASDYL